MKRIILPLLGVLLTFLVVKRVAGEVYTYNLDPRGTYLRTNQDQAWGAKIVDLNAIGATPGQLVLLQLLGGYSARPDRLDNTSSSMIGVFSSSDILLPASNLYRVPGALDYGADAVTIPTYIGMYETDIPEDFQIRSTIAEVPQQATHLFVSPSDCFFQDNTDDDGNYRLRITTVIPEPSADFNHDGNVDLVDVNLLTAEANLPVGLAVPPADTKFDLNRDNIVNSADLDKWLADAAIFNGLASPYLRGDANLDGDVDVWASDSLGDAQILSENMGMTTGAVWGDGDFNGDGDVDVWDFDGSGDAQVLSENMGTAHDVGATVVPEPSTLALLAMGAFGLFGYAWRRRR